MSISRLAILALTGAAFLGGAAQAQTAAIDTDGDGMYSWPELQAAMPDMTEDGFTALDTNGDGMLDAEEIAAAAEAGTLPAE